MNVNEASNTPCKTMLTTSPRPPLLISLSNHANHG